LGFAAGRTQQQSPTAASPERYMQPFRHFILVASVLINGSAYSQAKTIEIVKDESGQESYWYRTTNNVRIKGNLESLLTSNDSFHIRVWSETQAIDIWTDNFKDFKGALLNYTTSRNDSTKGKFYLKSSKLEDSMAKRLYGIFESLNISSIPSYNKITGWQIGHDGVLYAIEIATPNQFFFREYWSPDTFHNLQEAVSIQKMVSQFFTNQMLLKWSEFINTLPKGCYQAESYFITCTNFRLEKN